VALGTISFIGFDPLIYMWGEYGSLQRYLECGEKWGQPDRSIAALEIFVLCSHPQPVGDEMAANEKGYSVTVKGPGHNFARDIDEAVAIRILNLVTTGALPAAGGVGSGNGSGAAGAANADVANLLGLTPKQFIAQKRPKTQYERIACLAYYLTNARGTPQFVTDDITALNTEAAQHPILNAPQIVRDTAQKYRYLTGAGDRNKQITVLGEAVVEALPNRDAVKAAIADNRPPTGKRKKRAPKK
jgi:hypothetical protein